MAIYRLSGGMLMFIPYEPYELRVYAELCYGAYVAIHEICENDTYRTTQKSILMMRYVLATLRIN